MSSPAFSNLECPLCSGGDFEIRALKEEGLATVHCLECRRDYLLLDSEEYWFDVIQSGYPKLRRCGCKSSSFRIRCDYIFRDDGEVCFVEVSTRCSGCQKNAKLLETDIDYGGTGSLVTDPLTFCKNPKILYALQSLTLYATRQDIIEVLDFLHSTHQCIFHACLREDKRWVKHLLDVEATKGAVLRGRRYSEPESYFWIYASKHSFDIPDAAVETLEAEDRFWKRHELVRISSPTHISLGREEVLLFYIKFSNEYINDEAIVRKSDTFADLTSSLLDWLKNHFVSWRGPSCFDNPHEHARAFGDQFAKNRSASM